MILNPFKQAKDLDAKFANELREKVLADPEGHGLHGSLSDGVNKERMLELAREIEEREARRFKVQGSRFKEKQLPEQAASTRNEGKEKRMPRTGVQRKEARPLPEVLTTRWLYSARSAELQKLLQEKGEKNTEGKSIVELRAMARPLITGRTHRKAKGPARLKKTMGMSRVKPRKKKDLLAEAPIPAEQQRADNGVGLHVHCMACGFRMEISAEGIRALQTK